MSHGSPKKGPPDKKGPSTTFPTKTGGNGGPLSLPIHGQSTDGSQDPNYSLSKLPRKSGNVSSPNDVELTANYFKMSFSTKDNDIKFHRYIVKFPDHIKARSFRRRILALYIEGASTTLATDYNEILIAKDMLQISPDQPKPGVQFYEVGCNPAQGERIEFDIEFVKSLSLDSLFKDLDNVRPYSEKFDTIQALNIIAGSRANKTTGVVQVQKTQYYPITGGASDSKDLKQGLRVFRGFSSSVRPADRSLILNLNVSTGCFYNGGNIIDLARDFGYPHYGQVTFNDVRFFRGLRLRMDYLNDWDSSKRRKIRVITDLPTTPDGSAGDATNTKFDWAHDNQNETVTVEEYYQRKYPGKLRQAKAMVVDVGAKKDPNNQKTEYIPGEFCKVVPGQPFSGRLSFTQGPEMIRFACNTPAENATTIMGSGRRLFGLDNQTSGLSLFGIHVDQKFLSVRGRRLEPPSLGYHKRQVEFDQLRRSWKALNAFNKTIQQKSLSYLAIHPDEGSKARASTGGSGINNFVEKLARRLEFYGLCQPEELTVFGKHGVFNPRTSDFDEFMNSTVLETLGKARRSKNCDFLLVILPSKDTGLYEKIKYEAEVNQGIQTIFCVDPNKKGGDKGQLDMHLNTFSINLCFKINSKLGGFNHRLNLQGTEMGFFGERTMVVGVDVTHPAPGSASNAKSIAAMVASTGDDFAQFPGCVRIQAGREEMVQEIGEMMRSRLRRWYNRNGDIPPERVVIFRDGVSEGQLEMVLEKEKSQLDTVFAGLYGTLNKPLPKLTIIVVDKRHHTRFYEGNSGAYTNPSAGTIVDSVVTMPRNLDFFLQAHHAIKGTAKPTRYILLWDDNRWTAEQIETLSHAFCYMSARCSKPLSIPAPVFYADLLCERAAKHVKVNPAWDGTLHKDIQNTMFYI